MKTTHIALAVCGFALALSITNILRVTITPNKPEEKPIRDLDLDSHSLDKF